MVLFLRSQVIQVSKEPQPEGLYLIGCWQAASDTPDCHIGENLVIILDTISPEQSADMIIAQ